MKKIFTLAAIAMFCTVATNVWAGSSSDPGGTYTLTSGTITPPEGGVWDESNTAQIVVGTTYDVALYIEYDANNETEDDAKFNTLGGTLSLGGVSFYDKDNASDFLTSTPDYTLFYSITATEAMLGVTEASLSLEGFLTSDSECATSLDSAITLPVNVSPEPVPEPSTMLLFGAGLMGLIGYTRRRKNR